MKTLQESKYHMYPTAAARALEILVKKNYHTVLAMAVDIGVTRAYVGNDFFSKGIPPRYAGYFARKFEFHPEILCYEDYLALVVDTRKIKSYTSFIEECIFFSKEEKRYVLAGAFIKDPVKWLRIHDNDIVKKSQSRKAA